MAVRGMAATLHDAVCSGKDGPYSYRMMLRESPEGIVFLQDGFAGAMERCK